MIKKYYSAEEASDFYRKQFNINVSTRTVQRWCRSGRLKSIRPGKARYMSRDNLLEALTPCVHDALVDPAENGKSTNAVAACVSPPPATSSNS